MKFSYQIKAKFLLFIILSAMMHNLVPHVHHAHAMEMGGGADEKSDQHHHHDSNHHHHSDENENEHEQKSFLDFLFGSHSHSQHTHQDTRVIAEYSKPIKKLSERVVLGTDQSLIDQSFPVLEKADHLIYDSPLAGNPTLSPHPLRGPPSLG